MTILYLFALLPFYLLGALPTGYVISKLRGIELTRLGSGNSGATNVARILGARAGLITLLLDVSKGYLAVSLGRWVSGGDEIFSGACALAAVVGHCFSLPKFLAPRTPFFINLRGGKGVATFLGAMLSLSPLVAGIGILVFTALFTLTRIVSIASLGAVLVAPLAAAIAGAATAQLTLLGGIMAVIFLRHRSNIQRIIEGRERRLTFADERRKGAG